MVSPGPHPQRGGVDRQSTTPFHLKLFYRTGAFVRPEEFHPESLPSQHLQIYTWRTCSLRELSELLFNALPSAFPSPAAGTRLAFRLLYPDPRAIDRGGPARYMTKEIGSVVVGSAGSSTSVNGGEKGGASEMLQRLDGDPEKTLGDARFVVGDYVCVGIFPGTSDGAPGVVPREVMASTERGGPGGRDGGYHNGFREGRGGDRGGRYGGGGSYRGRGFAPPDVRGPPIPSGEWSRGERLPDDRRRHGGDGYQGSYRNGDR